MRNFILTGCLILCLPLSAFAQSPLDFYQGDNLYIERESYCMVNGQRLHYWLYTLIYEGKRVTDIIIADDPELDAALIAYAETLGWTRDYTQEMRSLWPNAQLAVSVINMMKEHRACVSMTIVEQGQQAATLVVNGRFFPELFASSFYTLVK